MKTFKEQKRLAKITTRAAIAQQLQGEMNSLGTFVVSFIYMGFWKRLNWVVFGASKKALRQAAQQAQQSRQLTKAKASQVVVRKLAEGEEYPE